MCCSKKKIPHITMVTSHLQAPPLPNRNSPPLTTSGCLKWRSKRMPHPADACGWGPSSPSSPILHQTQAPLCLAQCQVLSSSKRPAPQTQSSTQAASTPPSPPTSCPIRRVAGQGSRTCFSFPVWKARFWTPSLRVPRLGVRGACLDPWPYLVACASKG